MMARSPHLEGPWLSAANALRERRDFLEAERMLAEAAEHFPGSRKIALTRAWNAISTENWPLAEQLWRRVCNNFPDEPSGYLGLSQVLRKMGKLAELGTLAAQAAAQFPEHRDIAFMCAAACSYREAWDEAARQYRTLREKFPDDHGVPTALAEALRRLNLFDEADAVLSEAKSQFPNAPDIAIAHAQLAAHRKDWTEALRRWDEVLMRFADVPAVYSGMASAFKGAGLKAFCERLLNAAIVQFPDNEAIAAEYGWLAIHRRDWPTARAQWDALASRFPNSARILGDYGYVLVSCGDSEKAEEILREALRRFPNHFGIQLSLARSLAARSQWQEAAVVLSALQERHPLHQVIKTELGNARYNSSLNDTSHPPAARKASAPAERTNSASPEIRVDDIPLVCRFASLGEDCEFGLLQREVGAEPLGLLRFAGTTPKALAAALRLRFEGVGDPQNFELGKSLDGSEYIAKDKRFGMIMHTHIDPVNAAYEPTYRMVLRKVQYLKRLLVEDLEDGRKIFVYRDVEARTEAHLGELREALDLYGRPNLFVVKLAEPGKPNGFIELRAEHLAVGYIDRKGRDGGRWNIPVQSWLQLCRNACDIWPALN